MGFECYPVQWWYTSQLTWLAACLVRAMTKSMYNCAGYTDSHKTSQCAWRAIHGKKQIDCVDAGLLCIVGEFLIRVHSHWSLNMLTGSNFNAQNQLSNHFWSRSQAAEVHTMRNGREFVISPNGLIFKRNHHGWSAAGNRQILLVRTSKWFVFHVHQWDNILTNSTFQVEAQVNHMSVWVSIERRDIYQYDTGCPPPQTYPSSSA